MTARELKDRLYSRHFGHGGQMPGPWTCVEEYRGIDLLAFSAWSSASRYARIGYEVKVTRADLRRELLAPHKRARNVEWCHEFYLALPTGLLTSDELDYVEPDWQPEDWSGERCPGIAGIRCQSWRRSKRGYHVRVPVPSTLAWHLHEEIVCPTCDGRGFVTKSRVEQEAPTCWIPRDVGLVTVDGRGTRLVKKSPRRKEVPALSDNELGLLVRWVSMRPDVRHHPRQAVEVAA